MWTRWKNDDETKYKRDRGLRKSAPARWNGRCVAVRGCLGGDYFPRKARCLGCQVPALADVLGLSIGQVRKHSSGPCLIFSGLLPTRMASAYLHHSELDTGMSILIPMPQAIVAPWRVGQGGGVSKQYSLPRDHASPYTISLASCLRPSALNLNQIPDVYLQRPMLCVAGNMTSRRGPCIQHNVTAPPSAVSTSQSLANHGIKCVVRIPSKAAAAACSQSRVDMVVILAM